MTPRIIIGTTSFRKIRENNFYYVDKTSFLADFLNGGPDEVTLLTRPRRFGKTLTMNMLQEFLDIRNDPSRTEIKRNGYGTYNDRRETHAQADIVTDGNSLFDGLEIMRHPDICEKWMHQCPVVFLSLKDMGTDRFSMAIYH